MSSSRRSNDNIAVLDDSSSSCRAGAPTAAEDDGVGPDLPPADVAVPSSGEGRDRDENDVDDGGAGRVPRRPRPLTGTVPLAVAEIYRLTLVHPPPNRGEEEDRFDVDDHEEGGGEGDDGDGDDEEGGRGAAATTPNADLARRYSSSELRSLVEVYFPPGGRENRGDGGGEQRRAGTGRPAEVRRFGTDGGGAQGPADRREGEGVGGDPARRG